MAMAMAMGTAVDLELLRAERWSFLPAGTTPHQGPDLATGMLLRQHLGRKGLDLPGPTEPKKTPVSTWTRVAVEASDEGVPAAVTTGGVVQRSTALDSLS
eukprot:SAG31_NODE_7188_length_1762_cov_1.308479_1_plen_100_part_00